MTPYTPEEIALAREVTQKLYPNREHQVDRWAAEQGALAAIRATTDRAAKLLDGGGGKVIPLLSAFAPLVSGNNMPCMSGDARDRLRPHVRQRFDDRIASVAKALRQNHHLKDRPDAG